MSDQTLEERVRAIADAYHWVDTEDGKKRSKEAWELDAIADDVRALAIRASCLAKAEKMEGRKMLATIAKLEETNKRLNRRCQSAESGLAEKIDAAYRLAPNLGRALANSAAKMYGHRVESLEKALGPVVEALGDHYCGLHDPDCPYHAVDPDNAEEVGDCCRGNLQAYRTGKDLLDE